MGGVQIGSGHLAECGYCFFGAMAKLYKQDFAPYLPAVVERLFHSCQLEETESFGDAEDADEDVDVEEGDDLNAGVTFNNAIAEEKETAVDALGVIFENTERHFMPYLQKTIQIVQELSDHGHEEVRKSCVSTFFRLLCGMWRIYHPDTKCPPGLPPVYTVHPDVQQMIKLVMDEAMVKYDEEDEKMVIAHLNAELMDSLRLLGPALVANHLEALSGHIMTLLEKKATCQTIDDDGEDAADDDEDQAEYDALVIS